MNRSLKVILFVLITTSAYLFPKTLTFAPSGPENGAGKPVISKTQEKTALEFLGKILESDIDIDRYVQSVLICGPSLYGYIAEEKDMKKIGILTKIKMPIQGTGRFQTFETRTYKNNDIKMLFKSQKFKSFLKSISDGNARPANQEERDLYYSFISYEIAGKPVTVVENKDHALLLDFVDDKIFYMDMISEYRQDKGEKSRGETNQKKEPTDLLEIILLNDNDTLANNVDVQDISALIVEVKEAVKTYFKDWSGSGQDMIIRVDLFKNGKNDMSIKSVPGISDVMSEALKTKLGNLKMPKIKNDKISFELKFQINNGSKGGK